MYAGRVACCPLVSHVEDAPRAPLRLEKDGTDRRTDGRTPDRYITLDATSVIIIITGPLMGQYCFARWRLSSSSVVCNTSRRNVRNSARGSTDGGPVVLRPVKATPCSVYIVRMHACMCNRYGSMDRCNALENFVIALRIFRLHVSMPLRICPEVF